MKRSLLIGTGILTIAVSVWAAAGRATPQTSASPSARESAEPALVTAPGRVEAISENVEIAAEVRGRLIEVAVNEGNQVHAGQVLARIDDADYRARVQSAEAQLAISIAEQARVVNGARTEERREASAQRAQADAALEQANNELSRRASLLRDGAISREEYERVARDARQARARLDELTERARFVDAEPRADDLARATASVELARARVAEAQALLAKTTIRAPMAGTVIRRHRQTGELVAPEAGQSLIVTLADLSRLRVRADVDETDVARLGLGQRVWVKADAFGDERFAGRVSRIGETLGRKNVRTDEPAEKIDTKILETLVDLDGDAKLPLGLRVDVFIEAVSRR